MSQGLDPDKTVLIPPEPVPAGAEDFDQALAHIAAGMYSLASMLVGESEDTVSLVEHAVAATEGSDGDDAAQVRKGSRLALCKAALQLLARRDPLALAAPLEIGSAGGCIDDDDLEAAGVSGQELERMLSGPDRERVRRWLASLPTAQRVIFAMRAVGGLNSQETTDLLVQHGGRQAAKWTRDAVRTIFRQALCSLASQLLHETIALA